MVEALYQELEAEQAREFESHVSSCTTCASVYEEMRATGAVMREHCVHDPGEDYWNDYYTRLEARMERESAVGDLARITARRRSYVSWGYRVAAAVAVLAAGVWIGRSSMNNQGHITQPAEVARNDSQPSRSGTFVDTTSVAHEDTGGTRKHDAIDGPTHTAEPPRSGGNVQLASVDVRAKGYIERSQVLLLELVNARPDTTRAEGDYHAQQLRASALVREASSLRDDLPGGDNRRLRELVTELQLVLREIANLESKDDLEAVEIIRNRVNREGVLLKIDVEQMREDNSVHKTNTKKSGAID
jgi:hypothetical protein